MSNGFPAGCESGRPNQSYPYLKQGHQELLPPPQQPPVPPLSTETMSTHLNCDVDKSTQLQMPMMIAPGNHARAWNDPPEFAVGVNVTAKPVANKLNKRVAFPLSSANPMQPSIVPSSGMPPPGVPPTFQQPGPGVVGYPVNLGAGLPPPMGPSQMQMPVYPHPAAFGGPDARS